MKQIIPFIFYIALTIMSFDTHGQYVCKSLNSADAELNKLYKEILQTYAADSLFILKFKKAQRAWIIYRDAHIESLYPVENKKYYGSTYSMCVCESISQLTIARNTQLLTWVDGIEEGEVCLGSVKLKEG